jgi:hypothetical protein
VFPGISTECGALFAIKGRNRNKCKILLSDWKENRETCGIPQDVFVGGCGVKMARLPEGLLAKVWDNALTVADVAVVKDGINPGPASSREKLVFNHPRPGLLPVLRGSEISPYSIARPKKWICYDSSVISRQERRGGASLRRPEIFEPPKIVTRQTAPRIIAALDNTGYHCLNSVHITRLRSREADLNRLAFLLGLFNSRLINCLYRIKYGETVKSFPQVHVYAIRELPVRGHPRSTKRDREIAARIGELALAAGSRASPNDVVDEIDELTCDLYGINTTELRTLAALAGME